MEQLDQDLGELQTEFNGDNLEVLVEDGEVYEYQDNETLE